MSKTGIYTTSLIASFMIGLDCFVIGFIFLYPFLGLMPAIIIASGGWVLNTFVYYKDGPDNLKELLESKEKRSKVSWFINLVAFLGALFVLLFTIYAYLSLSAAIPALAMWITPFLITTMAVAYFIGTFTLNKSELTKDLLSDSDQSWFERFRNAILDRLEFNKENQSYARFFWLLLVRVFLPIMVALIVSLSLTFCFYTGCTILMVGCGMPYLAPFMTLLAISFFVAEFYFNAKQNIELVDKAFDQSDNQNKNNMFFTPGMMGVFMMVLANAIANGFIAMDASLIAIGAIALIKFVTGAVQSFCTMLNCCYEFVMDEEKSFDTLNGHKTSAVLTESAVIMTCLLGLYFISVFNPVGLFMVCPAILSVMFFKYYSDDILGQEQFDLKANPDDKQMVNTGQGLIIKTLSNSQQPSQARDSQNDSSLPGQSGGLNS